MKVATPHAFQKQFMHFVLLNIQTHYSESTIESGR